MSQTRDVLYCIFEQHLFNALVEDESADEFLARVVRDYLAQLSTQGSIAREHVSAIEQDLREEVLEMLRKKTYGHFNLAAFRKAKGITAPSASSSLPSTTLVQLSGKEKGRRSRRPC